METMGKPAVPVFKAKLDEKVLVGLVPALGKIPGPCASWSHRRVSMSRFSTTTR